MPRDGLPGPVRAERTTARSHSDRLAHLMIFWLVGAAIALPINFVHGYISRRVFVVVGVVLYPGSRWRWRRDLDRPSDRTSSDGRLDP